MAKKKRSTSRASRINAWIRKQPPDMRDELRNALAELQELFRTPHRKEFTWWHRVGSHALTFFPADQSRYDDSVIELLADYLEPGREEPDKRIHNQLYQARDFARTYEYSEAVELANKRNRNGKPLSISHIAALLSADQRQREGFLKDCLRNSWGVRRLRQEVQNKRGRKCGGGGRDPEDLEPQSAGVAIQNIALMADDWLRHHAAWFGEADPSLDTISRKDCDQAILNDAAKAIKRLRKMQKAVDKCLRKLDSLAEKPKKKPPT